MTRPLCFEPTLEASTEEGEVSQRIKHFVSDRLINRFQTTRIERFDFAKDHGVVQTSAANQPHPPHRRHVPLEAKGPRPSEFLCEGPRLQGHGEMLLADARVIEVNPNIEYGLFGWQEACPSGSILDLEGPEDNGLAPGHRLLDKP